MLRNSVISLLIEGNSVSAIMFFIVSVYYLKHAYRSKLGFEIQLLYYIFFLVGIGTVAFHATLMFEAQMLDELPMLFAAANGILVPIENAKTQFTVLVNLLGLITCVLYMLYNNPIFHEVMFGALITASCLIGIYKLRQVEKLKMKYRNKYTPRLVLTRTAKMFAFSFVLWNADHHFCDTLIYLRKFVAFPFDGLLQFHAWWHLFSSLAAAYGINGFIYTKYLLLGKDCYIEMKYKFLPTLIFKQKY